MPNLLIAPANTPVMLSNTGRERAAGWGLDPDIRGVLLTPLIDGCTNIKVRWNEIGRDCYYVAANLTPIPNSEGDA